MKFRADTKDILTACEKALRACTGRDEIAEFLLITIKNGIGTVTGNNYIIGVKATFAVEQSEDGAIGINAKTFYNILKKSSANFIVFETDGDTVTIKAGRSKSKLQGMKEAIFVDFPCADHDPIILDSEKIAELTRLTAYSASKLNDRQPVHTGVKIDLKNHILKFTAVDGFRFAIAKTEVENDGNYSVVIPAPTMQEVSRLMAGKIELVINRKTAIFKDTDCELYTRTLEGDFVDVSRAIPDSFKFETELNRLDLIQTIERVSACWSTKEHSPLRLTVSKGQIEFSMVTALGSCTDFLECDIDGELVIGLNHSYLLEALKSMTDEKVTLKMVGQINPILLTPSADSMSLILPVRLK